MLTSVFGSFADKLHYSWLLLVVLSPVATSRLYHTQTLWFLLRCVRLNRTPTCGRHGDDIDVVVGARDQRVLSTAAVQPAVLWHPEHQSLAFAHFFPGRIFIALQQPSGCLGRRVHPTAQADGLTLCNWIIWRGHQMQGSWDKDNLYYHLSCRLAWTESPRCLVHRNNE